ncbi:MAG TPA: AAA family ATPase, partial [Nannocystis sp.]
MVKLKRLKINQYRNVRPGTELHFDDGVNLVLGKNGAGKTTLLALLSHVAGSDFSSLQGESFNLEYDFSGGDFTARVSIWASAQSGAPDDPRYAERSNLHLPAQQTFEYRILISLDGSAETSEITGTPEETCLIVGSERQEHRLAPLNPLQHGTSFLDTLFHIDVESPFNRAWSHLYVPLAARFDESLDAFLAMTGRASVTASAGTPPIARLSVTHFTLRNGHAWTRDFAPRAIGFLIPAAHERPA